MKKVFELEDLDCANCAAKIETAVAKLDGVNSVQVNFMTQKMILDAEDTNFDALLKTIKKTARKIEPDMTILS